MFRCHQVDKHFISATQEYTNSDTADTQQYKCVRLVHVHETEEHTDTTEACKRAALHAGTHMRKHILQAKQGLNGM